MSFSTWPWRYWREIRPDALALILDDERLGWRELCRRVDALAAGFYRQGVSEGCGVALCMVNGPQALLAWLALLQCGARVLALNPKLPDVQLQALLPGLTLHYGMAPDKSLPGIVNLTWCEPSDIHAVAWSPARLVSMTLTSGSTGLPKAAVHSAAAHLANAAGLLEVVPYGADDNWLLSLPLFHVSGQGILWRWLYAGGCLTVCDLHSLPVALRGCSHASLVPTQLWRLLAQPRLPATLRSVLLGGTAIPAALVRQAQARGVSCWCGYGLTELASTVCVKRADGLADVGSALPGREVRIVDGEIQIRAVSMASGYWRNGEILPLTDDAGWFATRDRGRLSHGRLTVLGRFDNLFFCGGEGVQPEEVESVISAHPSVRQCVVVPVSDVEFGHRPVALVVCDSGFAPQRLALWVSDKLVRYQQPVRWLNLPAELNAGGIKISRHDAQRWAESKVNEREQGERTVASITTTVVD